MERTTMMWTVAALVGAALAVALIAKAASAFAAFGGAL